MAKAAPWDATDAHARKRGEQTGLDTLVVHALNDVYWLLGFFNLGKLFKNPISERWGKQICLN